jgi:DNA-directed RNA polymerase specialized sigma24 family protein
MSKESSTFNPTKTDFDNVLRLCKRLCRPPVDVESLTQEILYECWIKGRRPSYGLILHRCYDELRRLKKTEQGDPEGCYRALQSRVKQAEDRAEASTTALELAYRTISSVALSPIEQRVLYLRYYQNYTFQDIAASERLKEYRVVEVHNGLIRKLRFAVANQPESSQSEL